jgi:hypothetical protein
VEALEDCEGGGDDFCGGANFGCSCFISFCVCWDDMGEATGVGDTFGGGGEGLVSLKVTEGFSTFALEEGFSTFAMEEGFSTFSMGEEIAAAGGLTLSAGTSAIGFVAMGGLSAIGFVAMDGFDGFCGGCLIAVAAEVSLLSATSCGDFFL